MKEHDYQSKKGMNIAIIAPSHIPFCIGGAEKLWWGMLNYINQHTEHNCELIKLPCKENSFWQLMNSYYKFYQLDLSHFDLVISTKYPAWMVRHKNHLCYMQHKLRGLYDEYKYTGMPMELPFENQEITRFLKEIERKKTSIDDFFNILQAIRKKKIPEAFYYFPHSSIRKIIHFLDKKSMENIKKFATISQTVRSRENYFPSDKEIHVVYHPSNLSHFKNRSYDYFLAVGRLDGPKRVKLIVEAYLKSDTEIPLKIVGTGSMENEIRKMIRQDDRIELLGEVNDKKLIDLYARAYVVLYVPQREDYGLVTIEAMKSEKAVITCEDSGGVLEFVKNNENGLIVKPNVEDLRRAIEECGRDKEKVKEMGKRGAERVEQITWKNTIESLLRIVEEKIDGEDSAK